MPRIQNISKAGRSARGIGRFAKDEIKNVTDDQAKTFVDGSNFALVDVAADAPSEDIQVDSETADSDTNHDSTRPRTRRSKSLSNA